MGERNDRLVFYLEKPRVLAELFSVAVYGRPDRIDPQYLAEAQKTSNETRTDRFGKRRRVRRERDVVKLLCQGKTWIRLAVEAQDRIQYGMPFRCAEYDLEDLACQIRRIKRQHKENGDLRTPEERLGGIRKTDRLIPGVTLLLYCGEKEWDGAKTLQEMMALDRLDEKMKSLLWDYQMRFVNLIDLDETMFRTGLRELIALMKRRNDKEAMYRYYRENEERFRKMDDDTYDLICAMLHLKEFAAQKEKYREKEDIVDMCKAFEDLKADFKEEGKREGIEEGRKEGKKEGIKEGRKEGKKEGEKRFGQLITCLLKDNRNTEIASAAGNTRVRNRLYQEYGL